MNNGYYSPWGKLNLFLGAVAGIGLFFFFYALREMSLMKLIDRDPFYVICGVVGLVSAVFLFIRNMKLNNIVKTIGWTLLLIVIGAIVGAVAFIRFGLSIYRCTDYKPMNMPFANNGNSNAGSTGGYSYSKAEDSAARAIGYQNAADYENRTGFRARNIDPDEVNR